MDDSEALWDRIFETAGSSPVPIAVVALLVLVVAVTLVIRARRPKSIGKLLNAISFEKLDNVVLPKADEGEIHIEHILLTQGGIYVIDPKEIRGIVFGSDKMHDWTVLDNGRRYTIANPQGPLFDRVAAVRQVVTSIPVKGCILFGVDADFSKGRPAHVYTEQMLKDELPAVDGARASQLRASFDAEWQKLRDAAFSGAS
ncbi:MAG: nuclease-related domain-containing protein [Pseudomonadota bacterium]